MTKGTATHLGLACMMSFSAYANTTSPLEQQALQIMTDACPRLVSLQSAGELKDLRVTIQPAESYDEQQMGWKKIVQITATLTDPAKSLPTEFYANGHTCRYDVGDGGAVTAKAPCKKLCDFDLSSEGAAYRSIPATRSLNLSAD